MPDLAALLDGRIGDELPGAVALVARGEDVQVATAGTLSVGGPPVRRDSVFRVASLSKPITAAAVLALIGEGLLGLDEPVERLLPELADPLVLRVPDGPLDDTVAAEAPITVRHLLTYTFGFGQTMAMFTGPAPWPIVSAADALRLHTFGPPAPDDTPGPDQWLAALGSLPLVAQPGSRWLYNTSGSVLGVLAERAAGLPFGEVLRTRVFDPLGMRDTAFFAADPDRLATAYASGMSVWDAPDGAWSRPPAFPDGSGGLVSTVDDLLAFSRMLLGGGAPVLSRRAAGEMTRNQLTAEQRTGTERFLDGAGWGFGQAVVTEDPRSGAFGWTGGLGTSWLADPRHDLTVIVFTQRLWDTQQLPAIHSDVQAAAYDSLF